MAGETVKTEATCLRISPWSRTSHVVSWLTPSGRVATLVKGAVRPKSAFLGQYDLFYRCDLLYYARASGDLHALREVTPRNLRAHLRNLIFNECVSKLYRRDTLHIRAFRIYDFHIFFSYIKSFS